MTSNISSTALRRDCALRDLNVGDIPILDESVSMVALTLTRIFPHLERINYVDNSEIGRKLWM